MGAVNLALMVVCLSCASVVGSAGYATNCDEEIIDKYQSEYVEPDEAESKIFDFESCRDKNKCSHCRQQDCVEDYLQSIISTRDESVLESDRNVRVDKRIFNDHQTSNEFLNRLKVEKFLRKYQKELTIRRRRSNLALWDKSTNITAHNIKVYEEISLKLSAWLKSKRKYAKSQLTLAGLNCSQTRMINSVEESSSPKEAALRKESSELSQKIESIYSKAKVCNISQKYDKCYHFEPGLLNIMATSRNYDALLNAWKGWRDAIGPKIRDDWVRIAKIANIGARENGYSDEGKYWRQQYQVNGFRSRIEALWQDIKPLYMQLHAFVRYRLHQQYGDRVNLTGPIPAHILGNMWSMQWNKIYDIAKPFKSTNDFKVNQGMKQQNYTVHKMFTLADQFYRSLGLPAMPQSFWEKSMFTRPKNRSVVCYASAFNLESTDVRIKMCAQVSAAYFYTVHHEMGHCQYYLAYNSHQPALFQSGANHGFHEAIGDTAALSVINPTHLKKLGILKGHKSKVNEKQQHINFLMVKALDKLAFFPYPLAMDIWRWKVFSGKIPYDELNSGWWKERLKYQGIIPPVERSEKDFDPGSKYHITYFDQYIRYFLSHVIQFEFYESLCKSASHQGPLYLCDFAGSKKAGRKFAKMLQMGSSKHWEDTYKLMTGSCRMSVKSMIKYFQPLIKWLESENRKLGNKIGWD